MPTIKMKPFRIFGEISRVDEDQRIVEGYAYVNETVRGEGGVKLKRSAMEAATGGYIANGTSREMHQPSAVGKPLDVAWDAKGAYLRVKVVDDQAWKKVQEGVYKMFSVGVRPVVMRGKDCTTCEWWDTSLVDIGKDKDTAFSAFRGADINEDEDIEVEELPEFLRIEDDGGDFDDLLRAKWTTEKRKATALKNFGWPQKRKYPIEGQDDVDSAAKLIGKAPEAMRDKIKKRIIGIAKRLNLKVPDAWASPAEPAMRGNFDLEILRGKFATSAENSVPNRMKYVAFDLLDSAVWDIMNGQYETDDDRETDLRMAIDEFADFLCPIVCQKMWPDPAVFADVDTEGDMDRSDSPTLERIVAASADAHAALQRAESAEATSIERLETISTLTREREETQSELTRVQGLEKAATEEVTRLSNLPSRVPPQRSYEGLERKWGPTIPDDESRQIGRLKDEKTTIISRRLDMSEDERKAGALRLLQIDTEIVRLGGLVNS